MLPLLLCHLCLGKFIGACPLHQVSICHISPPYFRSMRLKMDSITPKRQVLKRSNFISLVTISSAKIHNKHVCLFPLPFISFPFSLSRLHHQAFFSHPFHLIIFQIWYDFLPHKESSRKKLSCTGYLTRVPGSAQSLSG